MMNEDNMIVDVDKLYNDFLQCLFDINQNTNLKFLWCSINEYKFYNLSSLTYTNFNTNNVYLQKYKNNKTGLAEDVLENGSHFPIFGIKNGGNYYVCAGKHRIYSLLMYNKLVEKIDKKFLMLTLEIESENELEFKDIWFELNKILKPYIYLSNGESFKTIMDLYKYLDKLAHKISNYDLNCNYKFKSSIVNNQNELHEFLKGE